MEVDFMTEFPDVAGRDVSEREVDALVVASYQHFHLGRFRPIIRHARPGQDWSSFFESAEQWGEMEIADSQMQALIPVHEATHGIMHVLGVGNQTQYHGNLFTKISLMLYEHVMGMPHDVLYTYAADYRFRIDKAEPIISFGANLYRVYFQEAGYYTLFRGNSPDDVLAYIRGHGEPWSNAALEIVQIPDTLIHLNPRYPL
jgi:hypothetical protein